MSIQKTHRVATMSSSIVSNSIMIGILFVLIILIVHFAVKSTVEHRVPNKEHFQSSYLSQPSMSSQPSPSSQPSMSSQPSQSLGNTNEADLLDYVYGGGVSNIVSTLTPHAPLVEIPKTQLNTHQAPPPLPESTGMASEGLTTDNGYCIVNKFQNEIVMCGGALYPDAPGVQGFDGGASMPFSDIQ